MSESSPPPPPVRRIPRAHRPPVEITFEESPSMAPAAVRNSLYHVRKALVSPRVLAAVVAVSGYAWAGAQYVAGTARQSDLQTAVLRIDALQQQLQTAKAESAAALDVGRQCVAQQGASSLALKALVGQIAAQRGRTERTRRSEQNAAEARYATAIGEGQQPHEAVRAALTDE